MVYDSIPKLISLVGLITIVAFLLVQWIKFLAKKRSRAVPASPLVSDETMVRYFGDPISAANELDKSVVQLYPGLADREFSSRARIDPVRPKREVQPPDPECPGTVIQSEGILAMRFMHVVGQRCNSRKQVRSVDVIAALAEWYPDINSADIVTQRLARIRACNMGRDLANCGLLKRYKAGTTSGNGRVYELVETSDPLILRIQSFMIKRRGNRKKVACDFTAQQIAVLRRNGVKFDPIRRN